MAAFGRRGGSAEGGTAPPIDVGGTLVPSFADPVVAADENCRLYALSNNGDRAAAKRGSPAIPQQSGRKWRLTIPAVKERIGRSPGGSSNPVPVRRRAKSPAGPDDR